MVCATAAAASAVAGFKGEDPRYPDTAERKFQLPMRVMFVGAHPDDADYEFGATATKLVRAGAKVAFVSVCNGNKGHQTMDSDALARRRYGETQASAKVYGIEKYIVVGAPDCELEPTVEMRKRITRIIREFAPHMVVTHRPCDYHADHRATGQLVQDASYCLCVPLWCPETPVPEVLPFVMYAGDWFTVPRPFKPDLIVDGDDVIDVTIRALACHDSQLFEWLPPEYGIDPKTIPADSAGRLEFLRSHVPPDLYRNGELHRALVDRAFGGKGPKYVDVFEICEYSRPPSPPERKFLASLGFKWVDDCVRSDMRCIGDSAAK